MDTTSVIEAALDAARSVMDAVSYNKFAVQLNKSLDELKKADKDDSEPKAPKVEWQFYGIYDKSYGEEVGSSPMFIVKVPLEVDPSQLPAIIQSSVNNVDKRRRSMKKRKNKNLECLRDWAGMVKPTDFTDGVIVKIPAKDAIVPYPMDFTWPQS
jgi:hypothetical protein